MVSSSLSCRCAYLTITHALLRKHSYLWFRTIKVLCFSIWYALVTYWHIHACAFAVQTKWWCMHCYPDKQLAHQILYIVLAKCGYFSCSLLVTKDTWVPPSSYPLPLFSNLPSWKQLSPQQKTAPKLFISTFRLFNKRSFTFLNCLTLVNGNKMWICCNKAPPSPLQQNKSYLNLWVHK